MTKASATTYLTFISFDIHYYNIAAIALPPQPALTQTHPGSLSFFHSLSHTHKHTHAPRNVENTSGGFPNNV